MRARFRLTKFEGHPSLIAQHGRKCKPSRARGQAKTCWQRLISKPEIKPPTKGLCVTTNLRLSSMESQTSVSKWVPREFRNWRVQGNPLTLFRQPFANLFCQPLANLSPTLCQPFRPTPLQPPLSVGPQAPETLVNGFLGHGLAGGSFLFTVGPFLLAVELLAWRGPRRLLDALTHCKEKKAPIVNK